MPGGDGTGPKGKSAGIDRTQGGRRRCVDKESYSGGPKGTCVCPECGYEGPHKPGISCIEVKCEKCGALMIRK
jgi:hypothetical protein